MDAGSDPKAVGEVFQQGTRYDPGQPAQTPGYPAPDTDRNTFPRAPLFPLPDMPPQDGPPLWRTLGQRRSLRCYGQAALDIESLSRLLWAAQGVTGRMGRWRLRASPSAGALHPCETYVAALRVEGLAPGVYHYEVYEHALALLSVAGDGADGLGQRLAEAACGQAMCAEAPVTFIWTAVIARCGAKYRQRAFRYVYLDAGHVAQNVALAAAGLGLGSCQIGAFFDGEVAAIAGVDGRAEFPVYMTTVGPFPGR